MANLAEPMDTAERCDGCRQRARYSALLPNGGVLSFCAHHAYRHLDALAQAGATVRDVCDEKPAVEKPPEDQRKARPVRPPGYYSRRGKGGGSGPRRG